MATSSAPPPPAPILESNRSPQDQIGLRPSFPESSSANSVQYLSALPHTVSIAFRHPGYDDQTNVLFRLPAFDSGDSINWGIHHHTALTACSIIACNISGFLSPTRLSHSVPAPSVPSNDSLLIGRTYYFYPVSWKNQGITEDSDLRYPVCPDFMDWQFPLTNFPPSWLDIEGPPFPHAVGAAPPPSQFSLAVQKRDESCRISGFRDGSQTAHLVPKTHTKWFLMNGMSMFNLNEDIPPKYITCDIENCLLLRQDLHTAFDAKHFVFIPKCRSWRIHFLASTADYGRLFHNRTPLALRVSAQFLYARFAWAIISRVKTFAELPGVKIRVRVSTGQWEDTIVPSNSIEMAIAPPAKRRRQNEAAKHSDEAVQDGASVLDSDDDLPVSQWKRPKLATTTATRASAQSVFESLVALYPQSWDTLRWHPDSDRLKVLRDRYLQEHEPVLHARERRRQLQVLQDGGVLWDEESESGESD